MVIIVPSLRILIQLSIVCLSSLEKVSLTVHKKRKIPIGSVFVIVVKPRQGTIFVASLRAEKVMCEARDR